MANNILDVSTSFDINPRQLIQVMRDIRLLHESFPDMKIKAKRNYHHLRITGDFGSAEESFVELENRENGWLVKSHNMPEKAATSLKIGTFYGLRNAVENFLLMGNNLFIFYHSIQSIETNCKVIEPVVDVESKSWRLVKYSTYVYIKIDFPNPLDASSKEITFYGKEHLVHEMKETYNKMNNRTDKEANDSSEEDEELYSDFYRELCFKLDVMDFPASKIENEEKECAICLCYENDDHLPFVCCNNVKCECVFHVGCVGQLMTLQSTKILTTSIAECPFCKQKISSDFIHLIKQCNLL